MFSFSNFFLIYIQKGRKENICKGRKENLSYVSETLSHIYLMYCPQFMNEWIYAWKKENVGKMLPHGSDCGGGLIGTSVAVQSNECGVRTN